MERPEGLVIANEVFAIVNEQLHSAERLESEEVRDLVYSKIVDRVPAGCLSEDVADAASNLYKQLRLIDDALLTE